MRVLEPRHFLMSALMEDGAGEHQDGAVHEQRRIERHHGVHQVHAARFALALRRALDRAALHEGAVKVEVVRHHGGAEDAHRHVQRGAVEAQHLPAAGPAREQARMPAGIAGDEPRQDGGDRRLGEQHLDREADADGGDEHHDQRLHAAHAEPSERQQEEHVEAGEEHAPQERHAEQKLEPDRGAQHFGQVAGDDRHLAEQPQRHGHRLGVEVATGLRQILAGHDAEPRRQGLQ